MILEAALWFSAGAIIMWLGVQALRGSESAPADPMPPINVDGFVIGAHYYYDGWYWIIKTPGGSYITGLPHGKYASCEAALEGGMVWLNRIRGAYE